MNFSKRRRHRNRHGISLTELLVGSVLLGASLAVVAELMALCVVANTKLFRQFDAQVGANFALDRIKRDVRMAQEIVSVTSDFDGSRKSLDSRTLILHLPVHFLAKYNDPLDPTYNSSAAPNQYNGFTLPSFVTVVYEVVPDPERIGEFMITTSSITVHRGPIVADASYRSRVDKQVIARGIIGPLEQGTVGSVPKVFSYIAKNADFDNRLDRVQENALYIPSVVNGLAGVGIDLEVKRGELSQGNQVSVLDKVVAYHAEVYKRIQTTAAGQNEATLYEN